MRALPLSALVAAAALTLTACSSTPEAADATTSSSASPSVATSASEWLVDAAGDDGIFVTEFDGQVYPDPGLTADAVLALLATGDAADAEVFAESLTDPAVVASYVGDGTTSLYVGSTAKLAATLAATGLDPRAVAGRDLLSELAGREGATGRFTDLGTDDYSQTVSQAWGVLALSQAGEVPAAAVDFLAAQQCDGAGYPAQLADAPTGSCEADADATAFAVSALVAAGTDAGAPEVAGALTWLTDAARSDDDGQYWIAADTAEPSVNSTAVVTVALRDAGEEDERALEWLEAQAASSGADAGAFTVGGVPDARATAQALLALSGTGLTGLLG